MADDHTTKLTPRDYALRIGISPQLVYYHLRNHPDELAVETCVCGRKVLDIDQADKYFDFNQSTGEETPDVATPSPTDADAVGG